MPDTPPGTPFDSITEPDAPGAGRAPADPGTDGFAQQIKETADKLLRDKAGRGDVKLLATALKELRYCFKVFGAYRGRRKVTVFGSARTRPDHPAYRAAVEFGRRMAEAGYMVITGAARGIMEAGHVGAGAGQQLRRQHPAAVRAVGQPGHHRRPEADDHAVLLHPQAGVHQGVRRGRAVPRRVRHPRRGVRGADPDPDRQDPPLPDRHGGRAGRQLLATLAGVHQGGAAGRTATSRRRTCTCSGSPTRSRRR